MTTFVYSVCLRHPSVTTPHACAGSTATVDTMTTTPRHRRLATVALATAFTGALAVTTAGTAGATDLPSSSEVQSQVSGAVEDSVEYGGYVAGSVDGFFRLPVDQAIFGSAAAGALALCLILPTPDGTCVI